MILALWNLLYAFVLLSMRCEQSFSCRNSEIVRIQTTPHAAFFQWFVSQCVVALVLFRHQDIWNAIITSGCRLESSLVHRLKLLCHLRFQSPVSVRFGCGTPYVCATTWLWHCIYKRQYLIEIQVFYRKVVCKQHLTQLDSQISPCKAEPKPCVLTTQGNRTQNVLCFTIEPLQIWCILHFSSLLVVSLYRHHCKPLEKKTFL